MIEIKHIVFGDIHGEINLLNNLLQEVERSVSFGPECRPVFLGDLVDRGKHSYEVVSRVKALDAVVLRGNHEQMMITEATNGDWYAGRESIWRFNGGSKTIESYGGTWPKKNQWLLKFETQHGAWMRDLPLYYETPDLWFSHAPVESDPLFNHGHYKMDADRLLWNSPVREGKNESKYALDMGAQRQIVGHIHALGQRITIPRFYPHIIYADTGCGCADFGVLTALVIDGRDCKGYYQAHPGGPVSYTPVDEKGSAE